MHLLSSTTSNLYSLNPSGHICRIEPSSSRLHSNGKKRVPFEELLVNKRILVEQIPERNNCPIATTATVVLLKLPDVVYRHFSSMSERPDNEYFQFNWVVLGALSPPPIFSRCVLFRGPFETFFY